MATKSTSVVNKTSLSALNSNATKKSYFNKTFITIISLVFFLTLIYTPQVTAQGSTFEDWNQCPYDSSTDSYRNCSYSSPCDITPLSVGGKPQCQCNFGYTSSFEKPQCGSPPTFSNLILRDWSIRIPSPHRPDSIMEISFDYSGSTHNFNVHLAQMSFSQPVTLTELLPDCIITATPGARNSVTCSVPPVGQSSLTPRNDLYLQLSTKIGNVPSTTTFPNLVTVYSYSWGPGPEITCPAVQCGSYQYKRPWQCQRRSEANVWTVVPETEAEERCGVNSYSWNEIQSCPSTGTCSSFPRTQCSETNTCDCIDGYTGVGCNTPAVIGNIRINNGNDVEVSKSFTVTWTYSGSKTNLNVAVVDSTGTTLFLGYNVNADDKTITMTMLRAGTNDSYTHSGLTIRIFIANLPTINTISAPFNAYAYNWKLHPKVPEVCQTVECGLTAPLIESPYCAKIITQSLTEVQTVECTSRSIVTIPARSTTCDSGPCSNGGYCGSNKCYCSSGWGGIKCTTPPSFDNISITSIEQDYIRFGETITLSWNAITSESNLRITLISMGSSNYDIYTFPYDGTGSFPLKNGPNSFSLTMPSAVNTGAYPYVFALTISDYPTRFFSPHFNIYNYEWVLNDPIPAECPTVECGIFNRERFYRCDRIVDAVRSVESNDPTNITKCGPKPTTPQEPVLVPCANAGNCNNAGTCSGSNQCVCDQLGAEWQCYQPSITSTKITTTSSTTSISSINTNTQYRIIWRAQALDNYPTTIELKAGNDIVETKTATSIVGIDNIVTFTLINPTSSFTIKIYFTHLSSNPFITESIPAYRYKWDLGPKTPSQCPTVECGIFQQSQDYFCYRDTNSVPEQKEDIECRNALGNNKPSGPVMSNCPNAGACSGGFPCGSNNVCQCTQGDHGALCLVKPTITNIIVTLTDQVDQSIPMIGMSPGQQFKVQWKFSGSDTNLRFTLLRGQDVIYRFPSVLPTQDGLNSITHTIPSNIMPSFDNGTGVIAAVLKIEVVQQSTIYHVSQPFALYTYSWVPGPYTQSLCPNVECGITQREQEYVCQRRAGELITIEDDDACNTYLTTTTKPSTPFISYCPSTGTCGNGGTCLSNNTCQCINGSSGEKCGVKGEISKVEIVVDGVTQPIGFNAGVTFTIKWVFSGSQTDLKIELINGGTTEPIVLAAKTATTHGINELPFVMPNSISSSSSTIRLTLTTDPTVYRTSPTFSVYTYFWILGSYTPTSCSIVECGVTQREQLYNCERRAGAVKNFVETTICSQLITTPKPLEPVLTNCPNQGQCSNNGVCKVDNTCDCSMASGSGYKCGNTLAQITSVIAVNYQDTDHTAQVIGLDSGSQFDLYWHYSGIDTALKVTLMEGNVERFVLAGEGLNLPITTTRGENKKTFILPSNVNYYAISIKISVIGNADINRTSVPFSIYQYEWAHDVKTPLCPITRCGDINQTEPTICTRIASYQRTTVSDTHCTPLSEKPADISSVCYGNNSCQNGSTCDLVSHKCDCLEFFSGESCQNTILPTSITLSKHSITIGQDSITITWSVSQPGTKVDLVYRSSGDVINANAVVIQGNIDADLKTYTFTLPSSLIPSTPNTSSSLIGFRAAGSSTSPIVSAAAVKVVKYTWVVGEWGKCSTDICSPGRQQRQSRCKSSYTNSFVSNIHCNIVGAPISIQGCIPTGHCEQRIRCNVETDTCACMDGKFGNTCQGISTCSLSNTENLCANGGAIISTGSCDTKCTCSHGWVNAVDVPSPPTTTKQGCTECGLKCHTSGLLPSTTTTPLPRTGKPDLKCTKCACSRGFWGPECGCTQVYWTVDFYQYPTEFNHWKNKILAEVFANVIENESTENYEHYQKVLYYVTLLETTIGEMMDIDILDIPIVYWRVDNNVLKVTFGHHGSCKDNTADPFTLLSSSMNPFSTLSATPTQVAEVNTIFSTLNEQQGFPIGSFSIKKPLLLTNHLYDPNCSPTDFSSNDPSTHNYSCSSLSYTTPFDMDAIPPTVEPEPTPEEPEPEEPLKEESNSFLLSGIFWGILIPLIIIAIITIVLIICLCCERKKRQRAERLNAQKKIEALPMTPHNQTHFVNNSNPDIMNFDYKTPRETMISSGGLSLDGHDSQHSNRNNTNTNIISKHNNNNNSGKTTLPGEDFTSPVVELGPVVLFPHTTSNIHSLPPSEAPPPPPPLTHDSDLSDATMSDGEFDSRVADLTNNKGIWVESDDDDDDMAPKGFKIPTPSISRQQQSTSQHQHSFPQPRFSVTPSQQPSLSSQYRYEGRDSQPSSPTKGRYTYAEDL